MSSPAAQPAEPSEERPNENEEDLDAEMADVAQDNSTTTGIDAGGGAGAIAGTGTGTTNDRSSTVDNDPSSTTLQGDTATLPQTSNHAPPSRKDVTLREFLSKMDDYAPIIPDAVTAHYLTLAGLPPPSAADPSGATTGTTPLPLARLLALATQKFVADVAADAYQYSRIRASNSAAGGALGPGLPGQGVPGASGAGGAGGGGAGGKGGQAAQLGVQRAGYGGGGTGGSGQGKTVLTMEDLGMAVQEYGINVKRGEFYR